MIGISQNEHFSGNDWNSANCYSESENVTRDGVSAVSVRSNLSKSPVEEYWEGVVFFTFWMNIVLVSWKHIFDMDIVNDPPLPQL